MHNLTPNSDNATRATSSGVEKTGRLGVRKRVAVIMEALEAEFPDTPVPLDHKDPYTLLVAVLLSAQCTDERVNQVTPALFALADNPIDMSNVPEEKILEVIRPCGLGPQKATAISGLSRMLLESHSGEVPANLKELESLPGVGHKTAQVVMAQAFGIPSFPVDTHIHRLAQRWGLTNGKSVQQTERDLKRLFPESAWNKLHLQIIYYGRKYCTARRTCDGSQQACPLCPVLNRDRKIPRKTKKA